MKYDWRKLKRKFLKDNLSLKDFAEKENIPYRTMRKGGLGWGKIGAKIEEKKDKLIVDKVAEIRAKKESESIENHFKLGEKMVEVASSQITNVVIENASQLSSLARTGVDIQRQALGLEEKKDNTTMIQVNFVNMPDTNKIPEFIDITKDIADGNGGGNGNGDKE